MVGLSKTVSPYRFFLLTYILSWAIWIGLILASSVISEGISMIVRLFGVLMPAFSAIALTGYTAGRKGVNQLLSRLRIWKVDKIWKPALIFVYPILLVIAGLIYNVISPESAISFLPLDVGTLIANIIFLLIAALGEEIGWRGVALPTLQRKYSPIDSSLILGLFWATWHLPFWILIGTLNSFGPVYFAMNFIFIIPTTFFLTWFFNQTRGSLLYPVLFHLIYNIVNVAIFPVTNSVEAFGILIALQFIVVLLIIPAMKKNKLAII
jgi:membrane protease YdiL (CAAX protease family)